MATLSATSIEALNGGAGPGGPVSLTLRSGRLGARTTLDVLNAEQDLLDARANLIAAQVDEIVSSYTLLSAMGVLTAEHLNLNVQLYDPEAYYNLVKDAPTQLSEQGRALDRVLEAIGQE